MFILKSRYDCDFEVSQYDCDFEACFEVCLEVCFILQMPGAYILGISLSGVFSSMFSVRWESMSVQSRDCRTLRVSRKLCVVRVPNRGCVA